jgi:hypothetical protein
MDKTQLINNVIIAVIALLSKEVILWLVKLINPIIKGLIKTLSPTVINVTIKYWRIFIDLFVLALISFMIRPLLSSVISPSRTEVFLIAFWTAWLVYWLAQFQTDLIQKLNKKKNTQQVNQGDGE